MTHFDDVLRTSAKMTLLQVAVRCRELVKVETACPVMRAPDLAFV